MGEDVSAKCQWQHYGTNRNEIEWNGCINDVEDSFGGEENWQTNFQRKRDQFEGRQNCL